MTRRMIMTRVGDIKVEAGDFGKLMNNSLAPVHQEIDIHTKYPDIIKTLVDNDILTLPEGTDLETVEPTAVIKFLNNTLKEASDMVKVATREVKHMQGVVSNLDNEKRAMLRKNLPASTHNASPAEIELLYAEHRFINAAEECLTLISSLSGDKVEELKLAYANLERQRVSFPELYKQRPKRWGQEQKQVEGNVENVNTPDSEADSTTEGST